MTVFWPTTEESKQRYRDYFNLSAEEQYGLAKSFIPKIEEELEIDRKHFGKEKQSQCLDNKCKPPFTTAGDSCPHCYICFNLRPDYYEWFHRRKMLCASWGNVPYDKERAQEYFKLLSNAELSS